MKSLNNKKTTAGGFSIIEMIVTMFIFSIIASSAMGIFVYAIRGQVRTLSTQQVLDQTSYVAEYMGRSMRMSRKEKTPPACLSIYGLNFEKINLRDWGGEDYTGPGIKFINNGGECQEFFLDETIGHTTKGQLMESKGGGAPVSLTANNLYVEAFNIGSDISWGQNDKLQPRVTFFLEVRKVGAQAVSQPKIKIQTTVSQRRLDISETP